MRQKILIFSINGALLFASLLVFIHCGIYTTTKSLNPPFGQTMDMEKLQFSGYNVEADFIGYTVYYKMELDDSYKVCDYDSDGVSGPAEPEPLYPTIGVPPVKDVYPVSLRDLYPQDGSESFYELYEKDNSARFYFAVSAVAKVGEDYQESERIEFGKWPAIE